MFHNPQKGNIPVEPRKIPPHREVDVMKRMPKLVHGIIMMLLVLPLALAAGCGGGGAGTVSLTQAPEEYSGVITGTIETADLDGAARATGATAARKVEGARVYAIPAEAAEDYLYTDPAAPNAATDLEGRFIITGVPSGNHTLVVDVDADGAADGMILNVSVDREKTTDCGAHRAEALQPLPENAGGINRKGTWCDVSLDKVIYATGETLQITLTARNETDASLVCGVLINRRMGKDHPEQWRSDFSDASTYVTVPAGGEAQGVVLKVIPEEWALTNTNQGSDYQVYPITADGAVWDKGRKDNFNILKHKPCGDDGACGDDDGGVTPPDDGDGAVPGDDGGILPGDDGGVPDDGGTADPGTGDDQGVVPGDDGGALVCEGGLPAACFTDADCEDGNPYTFDTCMNPGTCDAWCLSGDG